MKMREGDSKHEYAGIGLYFDLYIDGEGSYYETDSALIYNGAEADLINVLHMHSKAGIYAVANMELTLYLLSYSRWLVCSEGSGIRNQYITVATVCLLL